MSTIKYLSVYRSTSFENGDLIGYAYFDRMCSNNYSASIVCVCIYWIESILLPNYARHSIFISLILINEKP